MSKIYTTKVIPLNKTKREESEELKAHYSTKDEEFYFKFDNELGWVEI